MAIVNWSSLGWIERLVGRCLGPTRLHHAEFLSADQISWSAKWRVGLKIAAAGALLLLVWKDAPLWIPWMIGVAAAIVLLPLVGGTWPGMQFRPAGGTNVMPVYATMPVSFSQISRVLVTVNLVRFLVVLPIFFDLRNPARMAHADERRGFAMDHNPRFRSSLKHATLCDLVTAFRGN